MKQDIKYLKAKFENMTNRIDWVWKQPCARTSLGETSKNRLGFRVLELLKYECSWGTISDALFDSHLIHVLEVKGMSLISDWRWNRKMWTHLLPHMLSAAESWLVVGYLSLDWRLTKTWQSGPRGGGGAQLSRQTLKIFSVINALKFKRMFLDQSRPHGS